jgi:long-chain acyl-CoA synthetase
MELPPTLVHALQDQADLLGDRPALWTWQGGARVPTSWRTYARRVRHAALGLLALGLAPGERVAVLSGSREEALVLELATLAAGGVAVALHPAARPEQLRAQLAHTGAALLVVEEAAQARGVLRAWGRRARVRTVVVLDGAAGAGGEGEARAGAAELPYAALLARGEAADEADYWARVNALRPEGLARLAFTAGTTGEPRAVMLSHRSLVWTAHKLAQSWDLTERERFLSALPRAHLGEQLLSLQLPLLLGAPVTFAPPGATPREALDEALPEARPTVVLVTPAVWEGFRTRLEAELRGLPPRQAELVGWARRTAAQWHARDLTDEPVPLSLQVQLALARRLVFEPMRARLGLDRTRLLATWGPLGRDTLDFFLSLDLVVRELYGLVEAGGPVTASAPGATRLGRQGRALLGVDVRVAEGGELRVRSPGAALGYWEDPEGSRALLAGGWVHTGDVGELDDEGYLALLGRARELVLTASGRRVSPARVEGLLRGLPAVAHAVVLGERGHALVALVALDPARLPAVCAPRGWPADPALLALHAGFRAWLEEQVAREVNRRVSRPEAVKRVGVLPAPLSVEAGELTPGGEVRRGAVAARHHALVAALQAELQAQEAAAGPAPQGAAAGDPDARTAAG